VEIWHKSTPAHGHRREIELVQKRSMKRTARRSDAQAELDALRPTSTRLAENEGVLIGACNLLTTASANRRLHLPESGCSTTSIIEEQIAWP
jgi:hypothetical protein